MATLPAGSAASREDVGVRPAYRRAWRVLHACNRPRQVLPLVEGQVAAGMRPALVTLRGFGPAALLREQPELAHPSSLLSTWGDVRSWRRSLLESGAGADMELVHAHDFAPGMAAVRAGATLVYDVHGFIEENAVATQQTDERSWLARSFRVAEQFVISRAAAVVVHSARDREGALARGAGAESLFVIPEAMELESPPPAPDREWLRARGIADDCPRLFFADADPSTLTAVLEAFAIVRRELLSVRLLLAVDSGPASSADGLVLVSSADRRQALRAADLVIASGAANVMEAMRHARPLLAADCPETRAISPDGRGCLWYRAGDSRDLAARMIAVLREDALRSALAEAGHKLLQETRSPLAVATACDQVYRYAFSRRRSVATPPSIGSLQPISACL